MASRFDKTTLYAALGLGVFLWLADAAADAVFFYPEYGFWNLLILDVPRHELYIRLVVMAVCLLAGVALGVVVGRLKGAVAERELLLRELHHRVKNNMQIVQSLLNLQASYVKDPRDGELFQESRDRVHSMAMAHERLYQSRSLSRVDFADYIAQVAEKLKHTYAGRDRVALDMRAVHLDMSIDQAIPCGLIVNELLTNAYKHAFPGKARGMVSLVLERVGRDGARILVKDDGRGLPSDVAEGVSSGLGLTIVAMLAEQIRAKLTVRSDGRGAQFELVFPLK